MNLKEQQYIVTLAGCGSMTQAAKKLNITQPALSSYLAGVENSLGYPCLSGRERRCAQPIWASSIWKKARKILADNSDKLHQLAKYLYEKETITGEEFMEILSQSSPELDPLAEQPET